LFPFHRHEGSSDESKFGRAAEAPADHGPAVTGSIDQRGVVQVIGGVNEKIEGFFETCRQCGLTGSQGVILPGDNVPV
jgi:predicted ATP-dependent protease